MGVWQGRAPGRYVGAFSARRVAICVPEHEAPPPSHGLSGNRLPVFGNKFPFPFHETFPAARAGYTPREVPQVCVKSASLTESYFVNQLLLRIKQLPRLTSAED